MKASAPARERLIDALLEASRAGRIDWHRATSARISVELDKATVDLAHSDVPDTTVDIRVYDYVGNCVVAHTVYGETVSPLWSLWAEADSRAPHAEAEATIDAIIAEIERPPPPPEPTRPPPSRPEPKEGAPGFWGWLRRYHRL